MVGIILMNFPKIMKSSKYITKMYLRSCKIQKEELRKNQRKLGHNMNNLAESYTILRLNSKDNFKRINSREKERKKTSRNYTELNFKRYRAREQMRLFLRINN
jgi:hypothetical protein